MLSASPGNAAAGAGARYVTNLLLAFLPAPIIGATLHDYIT